MSCFFCISDEPINDPNGRIKTFQTENRFQTNMMDSPCANGFTTFAWFMGQCLPCTCCCTQVLLRQKVLENDMHKYQCCQGYINCCCFKAGSLGEESCPLLCLMLEAFFCSNLAVSSSRMYVMDRYQLSSDPCDYRLIRLNNCLQMLSCACDLLACAFDNGNLRQLAVLIDHLADLMYHLVSSCMTAQTAHEMDYQTRQKGPNDIYRTPANAYAFKPSAPLYEEHSPIIAQAYPYRQEEKIKY